MEDERVLARCLRDVEEPTGRLQAYERLLCPGVAAIFVHARSSGSGKAPGRALSASV